MPSCRAVAPNRCPAPVHPACIVVSRATDAHRASSAPATPSSTWPRCGGRPAQRARVMFSLTAMTCHRMSTAPGVPFRWKTRVFSRVMARDVSKIQVRLAAAMQKLVLLILLTALQQTRAEYRVRYGFVLELLRHDVRLTRPRPFAGRRCCSNRKNYICPKVHNS